MHLAIARGVELIASRFVENGAHAVDLATGRQVMLRRLRGCDRLDEQRWMDACDRLCRLWHQDMPPLLDYGFTHEGRFEAYGVPRHTKGPRTHEHVAIYAFVHETTMTGTGTRRQSVRVGMHLVTPAPLLPLIDVLEDSRAGFPASVYCEAEPGAGASTFLQMAAREARRRGYIPVSLAALDRWPDLMTLLNGRTWLLLADTTDSAHAARRHLLTLAVSSSRGHVLLQLGAARHAHADVALRLDPLPADVLVRNVHLHPARVGEDEIRQAAARSGGFPGRFLDYLRGRESESRAILRVAEARPAYGLDEQAETPDLEHPWSDLIASALRLRRQGRRAAAERELRQIAGAARRRQLAGAAAAAELELARLLAARGRASEARELLISCASASSTPEDLSLSAALALGAVHLEDGALEAAESAYRGCRVRDTERASAGLARTLYWQGRYEEAEQAAGAAREAAEPDARAAALAVLGAVALAQHNLPAAARAASQALSVAEAHGVATAAAAATQVLAAVHGRLGDAESVERYGRRALHSARVAGRAGLMVATRAANIDAGHRCGREPDRRSLERLLAAAERVPALPRAQLWAAASRAHPKAEVRADFEQRVREFVNATGARALLTDSAEPSGASLAGDVTALVAIREHAPTAREALQRIVDWVRERTAARAVLVCDCDGLTVARGGPADGIGAANRVLVTRATQPPWISTAGLEAAVLVRHADVVRGALACRWPLTRHVRAETVPLLTAAAAMIGPALAELAERLTEAAPDADGIIGRSATIERLRDLVGRAAPSPFPVVIEGESGVGKELVARAIHRASPRRLRACVAINCAALTEELLEAELFGHARGAFTGAHVERAGLFEQADGGTLFLDEIGELSARAQAKLLRALQDGEVRRLGENQVRRVDVRVIAASNRPLLQEADAGRFRKDLLFRLSVVRISVPPLRERREDIPLMAAQFWQSAAARAGSRAVLTSDAVARLAQYDWPGNVRELQNVVAALAVQVPRGRIDGRHVALVVDTPGAARAGVATEAATLDEARRGFERQFVFEALARCGGRQTAAARQLGLSRQGLAKLLKRLEIT